MDVYEKLRAHAKWVYQREHLTEGEWGLLLQAVQEIMCERNHLTEDEERLLRQAFETILQEMVEEDRHWRRGLH